MVQIVKVPSNFEAFSHLSKLLKSCQRIVESGRAFVSALVGSLTIGTTFFLSPISGILTDKIGIQMTTFLGGALASSGMLLSSLFSSQVISFFFFFFF